MSVRAMSQKRDINSSIFSTAVIPQFSEDGVYSVLFELFLIEKPIAGNIKLDC